MFLELENQNDQLKQKLETVEGILARREKEIEQMSQENQDLEYINRGNERRMQTMEAEHKSKIQELQDENSNSDEDLENTSHSYSLIKTKDTAIPRRSKQFNTQSYKPVLTNTEETKRLTKVVMDLFKLTHHVVDQFQNQKEQFEGQETVIQRIDDEIEKILSKQKELINAQVDLSTGVNDMSDELEEHWKLIEQITAENKTLDERMYKMTEKTIPSLKTFLLNKSTMLMNSLKQSSTAVGSSHPRSSIVLENQLNQINVSSLDQHLPVMNSVTSNDIAESYSSNTSIEGPREEMLKQDSVYMRVEESVQSSGLLGNRARELEEDPEIQKPSVLDEIDDVSSNSSVQSDLESQPRQTISTNGVENEKESSNNDSEPEEFDVDKQREIRKATQSLTSPKTFVQNKSEAMIPQSELLKRSSNVETKLKKSSLETILEKTRETKDSRLMKSSIMIDDIAQNRNLRASTLGIRRNSVMPKMISRLTDSDKESTKVKISKNWKIQGDQLYTQMVNSYNHQLRQKYICDLAAMKVLSDRKIPGYDISTLQKAQVESSSKGPTLGSIHYEEGKLESKDSNYHFGNLQSMTRVNTGRKESEIQTSLKDRDNSYHRIIDDETHIPEQKSSSLKKKIKEVQFGASKSRDGSHNITNNSRSDKCCTIF
uniref:Uncharacterized protein n=1 Tax=Euplotes crassus TaxID=5936 RepID=A0A7S3KB23_EUPCR